VDGTRELGTNEGPGMDGVSHERFGSVNRQCRNCIVGAKL